MRQQGLDGNAHVTLFVQQTSFVWDATRDLRVAVSPGGYGEPVTDEFELSFDPWQQRAVEFLDAFEKDCLAYIDRKHEERIRAIAEKILALPDHKRQLVLDQIDRLSQ